MLGLIQMFKDHPGHMMPLLAAGIVAGIIILERFQALVFRYPLSSFQMFFEKIRDLVHTNRVQDALALCERFRSKPSVMVVKEGLSRAHQPESLVEQGLEIAVSEAVENIQKRTQFLSTIANVATLLGLFGTVGGLIHSFQAVSYADPQQKAALLAQGISSAMNATMVGLGIAIPCMIAFSFFMNRVNRLSAEAERAAMKTLDIVKQRSYTIENHGSPLDDLRRRRVS